MSWQCHCGLVNTGLNRVCAASKSRGLGDIHYMVSPNAPDLITAIVVIKEVYGIMNSSEIRTLIATIRIIPVERLKEIQATIEDTDDKDEKVLLSKVNDELARRIVADKIIASKMAGKEMTEEEKLFQLFYTKGRMLVKDMDDIQIRAHREEMRKISYEGKVYAVAADDDIREREAKLSVSKKEWLLTDAKVDLSDAINVQKVKASRRTKLDKTRQDLLAAKIDESIVNEMVRNMQLHATDKNLKTVTFRKAAITDTTTVQVKKDNKEPVVEFDPSTLFGD